MAMDPTSTKKTMPNNPSAADALTFNVAGLLSDPAGSIRDIAIDIPPMVFEVPFDPEFDAGGEPTQLHLTSPIHGSLKLTRTNRGLLVKGRLYSSMAQTCARCLRDIDWSVRLDVDEEALPSLDLLSGAPVDTSAEPDSLRLNDHHELELEGVVRDAVLLAEPIAPLCRPDCPGLCIVCGLELSSGPHDHPDEDIDPRLEALRDLKLPD